MKIAPILLALLLTFACSGVAVLAAEAQPQNQTGQTITRAGTYQPDKAPEQNFTGEVSVQRVFPANEYAQFTAALVTFQPGARSNWHTHIGGQHLVVTEGGWTYRHG